MRNDLHGGAEIVAAPFLLEDLLVNLAGSDVVTPGSRNAGEAFVVTKIEVRLGPVIGHEDFPVLIRAHRARIHVEVRIEFAQPDTVPARLQESAKRC